ncbi:MAG TPA: proline--tRNA ligase [Chthonomonadales bacterium]|nr:proline--tRNA ligase [Chthonomonadales bacterium]
MPKEGITPRSQDYSQWYLDVVARAEMADYSPVRGCMVIRPTGYAIWENMQAELDRRIKATGHVNAYFPLFIPMSLLQKEAEHVEGFAPEVAVVTHAGGEELAEPLVVRPTSEAIIGSSFASWIHSWRDLPMLINQWANVVRWELRTRPFLRTAEFLWQEGHTAHATAGEAEAETLLILNDVYADFAEKVMALPVLRGLKTDREKFAGALRTYAIEAIMQDGRALQVGTSHNLGQNFARAFDILYQTPDNRQEHVWTTSWGVSTRLIGALIMAHSDDEGLVVPPMLAPTQIVVVPIFRTDAERAAVLEAASRIVAEIGARHRVKLDDREETTPGYKFNEWEMRGVPLRIEVGPKDVANSTVAMARRDMPGRDGKSFVPQAGLADAASAMLATIQRALYDRALRFREEHTVEARSMGELAEAVQTGFGRAFWDGSAEDEARVQEETKATVRVLCVEPADAAGACIVSGRETTRIAVLARAY